jgi:hypothetical protein
MWLCRHANRVRYHHHHRTLYENVLGPTKRKHRALLRLLAKYPNLFGFSGDGPHRPCHRVRLVVHSAWRYGDDQQAEDRAKRERALLCALCCFLQSRSNGSGPINDFMAVYGAWLGGLMPRRGDVIRFIRRHPRIMTCQHSVCVCVCVCLSAGPFDA